MTTKRGAEAILCIGSKCGGRERNVAAAVKWRTEILIDFRHSPIYATPDCHGGQREYMNAVCVGLTDLSSAELDALCKEYELRMGRDAEARAAGDVPVDIDVVVFDGKVLREKDYQSEFFRKGGTYVITEFAPQSYAFP